jgi:Spy/CpxP family protein refolding chaperone
MQQTKLVAALVIIGTFIAGGAIGVAADRALRPDVHTGGPIDSRTFWDRTATGWGLSTAQRTVVDSLMDAQRKKMSALYKPLRPTIDSVDAVARAISDSTQDQLRRVLTPEQQQKLDELRATMRKHDAERRARRMKLRQGT